ncbi:MAG: hypothetical protein A2Z32_11065 [Chloroflexi bacterium RBG_16_69_14]|nr:MAG: hypothetical protein A2Z32_11065 [Chloroflexi bacterium RBG_16_69_14]
MELEMTPRQPVQLTAGAFEASHPWVLGLVGDEDASHAAPRKRPYSFWAECECPADCLRDHENE